MAVKARMIFLCSFKKIFCGIPLKKNKKSEVIALGSSRVGNRFFL